MQDLSLFKKYKAQFLSLCFFFGGILIIFQVIVPSFQKISVQLQKNNSENKKLSEINASTQLIQSSDENLLRDDLSISVATLPPTKDISGIYNALSKATVTSGVFFEGFTVSPGGIYGEEKSVDKGIPSIEVSARISNITIQSLLSFLNNLSRTSPLSEVKDLSISGDTADIELLFFYKPYDLSLIKGDIVLPLTEREKEIIRIFKEAN